MNSKPLVSVICLCYNQAAYVEDAIRSVLDQNYPQVELIVVDDASDDFSATVINQLARELGFKTIFHTHNRGNCRSFNEAFKRSKGRYLIDLAADDILLKDRIAIGVDMLEKSGPEYGVHFSDVLHIDEHQNPIRAHYRRDREGKLLESVPQGDVYCAVLERYFISTPSMLIRRSVLEALGGYDETLTYEDFDFWVRSARNFKYAFSDAVLVKKRILTGSLSREQYHQSNPHLVSTAVVCEKAYQLNQNKVENQALVKRVKYELQWALITENHEATKRFIALLKKMNAGWSYQIFARCLTLLKIPVFWIFKLFYAGKDDR